MKTNTMDERTRWPYLPASIRANGPAVMRQFHEHVKDRIKRVGCWSRFASAGFIADDIECVWPESNTPNEFGIYYGGEMHGASLIDLNLRELEELDAWLSEHIGELEAKAAGGEK